MDATRNVTSQASASSQAYNHRAAGQTTPSDAAASSASVAGAKPLRPPAIEKQQKRPWLGLAASIAIAAALGSTVGAISAVNLLTPERDHTITPVNANAMRETLALLNADFASLKSNIDSHTRRSTAQLNRLSDRVERAEKIQSEPTEKLQQLTETVERLEKKVQSLPQQGAASDITGSIGDKQQERAADKQDRLTPERLTQGRPRTKPAIMQDWVLREIYDGRALVENQRIVYEAVPGSELPGLGRVETVRQQNGHWVVVTQRGLIVPPR